MDDEIQIYRMHYQSTTLYVRAILNVVIGTRKYCSTNGDKRMGIEDEDIEDWIIVSNVNGNGKIDGEGDRKLVGSGNKPIN
ncbi:hypothetical protein Q3G72_002660 [Acer saccharum]|nr:hypothetical protein Q3G72_002660 [Acer saccharum]